MAENLTFDGSEPDLESTEKNIFFSRPTTVFAAVAASIFTVIGVLGKKLFNVTQVLYLYMSVTLGEMWGIKLSHYVLSEDLIQCH